MVYREAKPTMSEETLDTTGGGRTLRSIMFIIIESGMALFSMQLVRLGLYTMSGEFAAMQGYSIILGMSQMIHVIIMSVIAISYFTDNLGNTGHSTYSNPGASLDGIVFP